MYSRIEEITIQNFMSIEQCVLTFDESNIITIKGYNDSGKSAIHKAIRVLFADWNRSKQKRYIKDGKEAFKITATFSDGVKLAKTKYSNGQSLYEMSQNGQMIYTNKSGKALTNVQQMPEAFTKYLSLSIYGSNELYAQSCNEPYLLAETKGSDNYKMLGEASDDGTLLRATEYVKDQIKESNSQIKEKEGVIDQHKAIIQSNSGSTPEIIEALKKRDAKSKGILEKEELTKKIANLIQSIEATKPIPAIEEIEGIDQIIKLNELTRLVTEATKPIQPEIEEIKGIERLEKISRLADLAKRIESIAVSPVIEEIKTDQLEHFEKINYLIYHVEKTEKDLKQINATIEEMQERCEELTKQCKDEGILVVECPKCGFTHPVEVDHVVL